MTNNFVFETDLAAKTIHVVREFNAPVEKLWRAWTEASLIEKWIAPKPWLVETKMLDFTVGGVWLYAMVGTQGEKHWVYAEFTEIDSGNSYSTKGMYCDNDGNPAVDGPKSYRVNSFSSIEGNKSQVDSLITFEDESTIKMFIEMGFKQGVEATLANLDELLASA